jgi:hypothetical protein
MTAADLARCNATVASLIPIARQIDSLAAYADAGLAEPDRSEGRMDDLAEVVRDLMAMHYTADEIRSAVERVLVAA